MSDLTEFLLHCNGYTRILSVYWNRDCAALPQSRAFLASLILYYSDLI